MAIIEVVASHEDGSGDVLCTSLAGAPLVTLVATRGQTFSSFKSALAGELGVTVDSLQIVSTGVVPADDALVLHV